MNSLFLGSAMVLATAAIATFFAQQFIGVPNWTTTTGVVEKNIITPRKYPTFERINQMESGANFELDLEYRYVVDGKTYRTGRILRGAPNIFPSEIDAATAAARYPVGSSVEVYFNPTKTEEAILVSLRESSMLRIGVCIYLWFCLLAELL